MNSETENALANLEQQQSALDSMTSTANSLLQPWDAALVQFLSVSLLVFTAIVLLMAAGLLWRTKASPQHVLRIFGIISIVGVSALLLVTGYSNDQLTPIVGLFGAIAGYLLGKDSSASPDTERG